LFIYQHAVFLCSFIGTIPATAIASGIEPPGTHSSTLYAAIYESFHEGFQNMHGISVHERVKLMRDLNEQTTRSLELAEMLSTLRIRGIDIQEIKHGSLQILFTFNSKNALLNLWKWYKSNRLDAILQEGLITKDVLEKCKVIAVKLEVFISEDDYQECLKGIGKH